MTTTETRNRPFPVLRLYADPYVAGLAYDAGAGSDVSGPAGPERAYGEDLDEDLERDVDSALAAIKHLIVGKLSGPGPDGLFAAVEVSDWHAAVSILKSL